MKKLLILIAALILSAGVYAQEKMGDKMKMEKMDPKMDMKSNHFMMENGKMMMIIKGKTTTMDRDVTLRNGTMVKMDGTVKRKNGKTRKLKEGDMYYVNGKIVRMKN